MRLKDAKELAEDMENQLRGMETRALQESQEYEKLQQESEKQQREVWSLVQYQQARRLSFRNTRLQLETTLSSKEKGLHQIQGLLKNHEDRLKTEEQKSQELYEHVALITTERDELQSVLKSEISKLEDDLDDAKSKQNEVKQTFTKSSKSSQNVCESTRAGIT
eukprot:TRINITY_DN3454_c0_g1_i1.p1 TRINITY_DN3454_c0_g1~~TRINITY_DN3454_c0_g1_i1.p1  ORF type:complete len:164 (-),score=29.99 TRINITY_DN3454_c0_g1_i1:444-935(-)